MKPHVLYRSILREIRRYQQRTKAESIILTEPVIESGELMAGSSRKASWLPKRRNRMVLKNWQVVEPDLLIYDSIFNSDTMNNMQIPINSLKQLIKQQFYAEDSKFTQEKRILSGLAILRIIPDLFIQSYCTKYVLYKDIQMLITAVSIAHTKKEVLFRYKIKIANIGKGRYMLRGRYWKFQSDAGQHMETQKYEDGVVGRTPVLHGDGDINNVYQFEYISSCTLPKGVSNGRMSGSFLFSNHNDRDLAKFEYRIPEVPLVEFPYGYSRPSMR